MRRIDPGRTPARDDRAAALAELLWACRDDPDLFNTALLGRPDYWGRQVEICAAVVRYKTVVVPTGNAVGKTFCCAGLVLWWLYTRPDSLVVVTAPSQALLATVLFKEIRRAHAGSAVPLPGKLTAGAGAGPQVLRVTDTGHQVLGIATRGVERMSGQHSPDLLVVVDEASGIEPEIWEALDSLNPAKLVAFGNPLRAEGRFRELSLRAERERLDPTIAESERVHEIRIPSTESPDIGLDRSPRGLADKGFLDAARRQYGGDGLWWRAHVLALFPEVGSDVLIPEPWLDWATRPEHRAAIGPNDPRAGRRRIACDLGEGVGRDRTVVLVRDDLGVLDVDASRTAGPVEAAATIRRLAGHWNVAHEAISYDQLGIGKDLPNHLRRAGIAGARGYAGSGSPCDKAGFTNLRTEAAWRLRNRLDPNWCPDPRAPGARQPPFHIPPAPWWAPMREELKALSYDLVGKQTRLISKQAWSDRLGRSADLADALIQSFAFA